MGLVQPSQGSGHVGSEAGPGRQTQRQERGRAVREAAGRSELGGRGEGPRPGNGGGLRRLEEARNLVSAGATCVRRLTYRSRGCNVEATNQSIAPYSRKEEAQVP